MRLTAALQTQMKMGQLQMLHRDAEAIEQTSSLLLKLATLHDTMHHMMAHL